MVKFKVLENVNEISISKIRKWLEKARTDKNAFNDQFVPEINKLLTDYSDACKCKRKELNTDKIPVRWIEEWIADRYGILNSNRNEFLAEEMAEILAEIEKEADADE